MIALQMAIWFAWPEIPLSSNVIIYIEVCVCVGLHMTKVGSGR